MHRQQPAARPQGSHVAMQAEEIGELKIIIVTFVRWEYAILYARFTRIKIWHSANADFQNQVPRKEACYYSTYEHKAHHTGQTHIYTKWNWRTHWCTLLWKKKWISRSPLYTGTHTDIFLYTIIIGIHCGPASMYTLLLLFFIYYYIWYVQRPRDSLCIYNSFRHIVRNRIKFYSGCPASIYSFISNILYKYVIWREAQNLFGTQR